MYTVLSEYKNLLLIISWCDLLSSLRWEYHSQFDIDFLCLVGGCRSTSGITCWISDLVCSISEGGDIVHPIGGG